MNTINKIMHMLDWNMPAEIQSTGRELAKAISDIRPFLQPLNPQYEKNVWENCAIVISQRKDEEIKPYLVDLLEWLQDMNWPGANHIYNRIKIYKDDDTINNAIKLCIKNADQNEDFIWKSNLALLIRNNI